MKKILIPIWTIAIILMIIGFPKADGSFVSIDGLLGRVTVTYPAADRDSTIVLFLAPLSGAAYDSVHCLPIWAGTRFLEGSGLSLDTLGVHSFIAKGFLGGAWVDTITGTWANFGGIIVEPGSGPGIFACSTFVFDTVTSSIVPNAAIEVRPDGSILQLGYIDDIGSDGMEIFALNPGEYDFYVASMLGFSITNPIDITISGNVSETLFVSSFDFAIPPAGFVQILVYFITPGGDTIQPSTVSYQYVDSAGIEYPPNTRLTLATGVVIEKGRLTEKINKTEKDSTFFSFPLISNYDVFVNGVQDSSSWVEFKVYGKLKNRVLVQVPKSSPFNPFAP